VLVVERVDGDGESGPLGDVGRVLAQSVEGLVAVRRLNARPVGGRVGVPGADPRVRQGGVAQRAVLRVPGAAPAGGLRDDVQVIERRAVGPVASGAVDGVHAGLRLPRVRAMLVLAESGSGAGQHRLMLVGPVAALIEATVTVRLDGAAGRAEVPARLRLAGVLSHARAAPIWMTSICRSTGRSWRKRASP